MKKYLLLTATMMATGSLFATQYMHVNLQNGKEYDIKIEKTDRVYHEKGDSMNYIKVVKKDNSYSLYPLDQSTITFDEKIARLDSNNCNWKIKQPFEGCKLELLSTTTEDGNFNWESYQKNSQRIAEYASCISNAKKNYITSLSEAELGYQEKANNRTNKVLCDLAKDSTKNYIFSPTSFQMTLAMLANGTNDDEIFSKITETLGTPNITLDSLNSWYKRRIIALMTQSPLLEKIGIANAAWLQKDRMFGKNFIEDLQDYYFASTNNVDFSDDSAYDQMDKWANEITNGMIPKMGINKNPDNILVLANGLSFQSDWFIKFDSTETKEGDFTTATGEVKQVSKMYEKVDSYAENNDFQYVSKEFIGKDYKMEFVLPKEGKTPKAVLASIDWENLPWKGGIDTINKVDSTYIVNLHLPKFNIDNTNPLNDVLKEQGLDIFDKVGYFEKISNEAYVKDIKQLTHLEINEKGTLGAAITEAVIPCGAAYMPIDIYVDMDINRPFIIRISNAQTEEVLFVGIINDPTSNN